MHLPKDVEGGVKIHGLKDPDNKDIVVLFHHLDGMYSYCTIEGDEEGKVVHLSASTPLIEIENGEYRVEPDGDKDVKNA